jgi:hypothetical protein
MKKSGSGAAFGSALNLGTRPDAKRVAQLLRDRDLNHLR